MRMCALNLVAAAGLLMAPLHAQSTAKSGVLPAADVEKLMPSQVFFHSQTATVQLRNSAAIRYADGTVTLAGLVDTSGYSTAQRETYQFYLLSDDALTVGGRQIAAGAYGCGFVPDRGLVVMDLGGHELFHVPISRDANFSRPRPLQITASGTTDGTFRLYLGREYVSMSRSR